MTSPTNDAVARHFLTRSASQLRDQLRRIEEAAGRLDDAQVWQRESEASNSVGNLLLHLAGNVRQHLIAGLGGAADTRNRAAEFAARSGPGAAELIRRLAQTVSEAAEVLDAFPAGRLLERGVIQGKEVVFLDDVYHVVEHFSYHAGQIIGRVKALTRQGFPWYRHLDPPA